MSNDPTNANLENDPLLVHKIKIVAYQLGKHIHIKNFKQNFKGSIYSSTPTEVFIKKGPYTYIYIQSYGEVAFSDYSDDRIKQFIELIKPFVTDLVDPDREYKEDFVIDVDPDQNLAFEYNSVVLPHISPDVIKIAMLNISQSVVLDYFTDLSQQLLHDATKYTRELEARGKLSVSKTELMKFIGKTLSTQNRITDNLYFIDAPDTVWDNEYLSHINTGLSKTFNLKTRFHEVEYTLQVVDSNLTIFSQLVQHRDANKLEWIIIILILLEVLNVLVGKFL
jgi:uncharacterized Rmd1/YagE family protein